MKDELSQTDEQILELLHQANNGLTTSQFRSELGIASGSLHYRYNKLEDLDLIRTEEGTTETNRTPPKVAHLTEKAKEEIRKGLLGSDIFEDGNEDEITLPREYVENLEEEVENLKNRVEALNNQHQESKREQERLRTAAEGCVKALREHGIEPSDYAE